MNSSSAYSNEELVEAYFREQRFILKSKVDKLLESYRTEYGRLQAPILIEGLIHVLDENVEGIVIRESPSARLTKNTDGKWLITIPKHFNRTRKRLEAAHEIAHVLLGSPEEPGGFGISHRRQLESELIDCAARSMLMPAELLPEIDSLIYEKSIARKVIEIKNTFQITAHAAVTRLFGDLPDMQKSFRVHEVIIWQVSNETASGKFLVTPGWKLTRGRNEYFVPIGKCRAKEDSSAYKALMSQCSVRLENVRIGSLKGRFIADSAGYWWKAKERYFRRIITLFRDEAPDQYPLFA